MAKPDIKNKLHVPPKGKEERKDVHFIGVLLLGRLTPKVLKGMSQELMNKQALVETEG